MADVVSLSNVEKVYPGAVSTKVLHGITLAFPEGGFNAIIGPSGSGKSTLMNIIGTLDVPTSGEVKIDGKKTAGMKKDDLARLRNKTIGFVFQFHHLLPEFSVAENVMMPRLISGGGDESGARHDAEALLGRVGLSSVMDNPSSNISGGQQQRTAIARALMNRPKLILADEPTGNLDTETTDGIYSLFREINKELGTTFIIVTHDRAIAERTDRIVEIRDGRIVLDVKR